MYVCVGLKKWWRDRVTFNNLYNILMEVMCILMGYMYLNGDLMCRLSELYLL